MNRVRVERLMKIMVPGMILLQAAGCNLATTTEFLQTVFLGITAAGSVAILQNI